MHGSILFPFFPLEAAPIAGVDFSSGGSFNPSLDDLVAGDGITVGDWIFEGRARIVSDNNAYAGCASAPVGKFNNPLSPSCISPNPGLRDLPAKSKFLAV